LSGSEMLSKSAWRNRMARTLYQPGFHANTFTSKVEGCGYGPGSKLPCNRLQAPIIPDATQPGKPQTLQNTTSTTQPGPSKKLPA
jgi:hypothetical protein